MTKGNSFEVSFSLPPAVRSISRPQRHSEPAVPVEAKYARPPRITQVLALALQFQEMIDRGEVRQHADLARLGCISRERVSQLMMLTWLAPDIQEAILRLPNSPRGLSPISEADLRSIARRPMWADQRQRWHEIDQSAQ
jgi:hypothetical protein